MRAILYAEETPTESPAAQWKRLQAYADAQGWTAARETNLNQAVGNCCRSPGTVLIVTRLERLGPPERALPILKRLEKLARDFVSLSERIDTTTTLGKSFWSTIPLAERIADYRLSRPKRKPARKRAKQHTEYGYRPGPTGEPIEDEAEQEVLRQIREMMREGESLRGICRRLDESGVRRRGKKWKNYHGWLARILERDQPANPQS